MVNKVETPLCRLFVVWSLLVVICFFTPQNLYADGKYYPRRAYKQPPDIPTQRAIVVYEDGVEELTIESALDGQGQEFGWVMPLPSKPLHFEKSTPGLIKTFASTLQPKIIDNVKPLIEPFFAVTVVITLGCLMSIVKIPEKRLNRLLLLLFITVFLSCLLMPAMGVARCATLKTRDVVGVKVHDVHQIGSYQLSTLEADSARALDKWLIDNDFAGLTDKDKPVISDYIKEGWFFVAAKLRRDGDGYSLPHPLTMSFENKAPLYPARLTSTLGGDVYLELFVIAGKQAKCDKLALEVSDEYNYVEGGTGNNPFRTYHRAGFVGSSFKQNIGHPAAKDIMWSGCVVSRLAGTLTSDDMAGDIVLKLEQAEPYQKRYYSRAGARQAGAVAFLIAWGLVFLILTLCLGGKAGKQNRWRALFIIAVCALLVSFIAKSITYAVLPKVDVRTEGLVRLQKSYERLVDEGLNIFTAYNSFDDMSYDETIEFVTDYFKSKGIKNMYTGGEMINEDSPGNFTVFEDSRGLVLRIYFAGGYPEDFVLKVKPGDNEK